MAEVLGPNAYWIPVSVGGVVEKVLIRDYVGDGTGSRIIDLGDEYDEVEILLNESRAENNDSLVRAYALGTFFGTLVVQGSGSYVFRRSMANAVSYFQGKMTGADSTKIKLGNSGPEIRGTNVNGLNYRIIAQKFSRVEA